MNQTLKKRLKQKDNKELLMLARAYKIENHSNSTPSFQRDYDIILEELKERGLVK